MQLRRACFPGLLPILLLAASACSQGGSKVTNPVTEVGCPAVFGTQAGALNTFVPLDINGPWILEISSTETACIEISSGIEIDFSPRARWHFTQVAGQFTAQVEDAAAAGLPETWTGTYDPATGAFVLEAEGNSLHGTFKVPAGNDDALLVFDGKGDLSGIFAGTETSCSPGPVTIDFFVWGLRTLSAPSPEPDLTGTWDLAFSTYAVDPLCDVIPLESEITVSMGPAPDGDPGTNDLITVIALDPSIEHLAGIQQGEGLAVETPGSSCAFGLGVVTDGQHMVGIGGRNPDSAPQCGVGFVVLGTRQP